MAEPIITPINVNPTIDAISFTQGAIFTATDRKIIEERGGEVTDRKRSFLDTIAQGPLSARVENELTGTKPEVNPKKVQDTFRDHEKMLKNSALIPHRDKVEISQRTPEEILFEGEEKAPPPPSTNPSSDSYEKIEIQEKTDSLAKELNLKTSDLFDKFTLEQKELYNLIIRIKELHLKRLLCTTQTEFEALTNSIRKETLAAGRPEAHAWLEGQLDELTRIATEYKRKIKLSLQSYESGE